MVQSELITASRVRLDDVAPSGQLWTDEQIVAWLNTALREACIRARFILESQLEEVCQIAVVAGQRHYPLHPTVIKVRTARMDGAACKLTLHNTKTLHVIEPDWDAENDPAEPEFAVGDYQSGHLTLHPVPEADGLLRITCFREPIEAELFEEGDDDAEPPIPVRHHTNLVDWVEREACLIKDTEAYDPERSAAAEKRFEGNFGPRPTEHSLTAWGSKRTISTLAEFL